MEALPVALPLLCAAALAAVGRHLHRRIADALALGTTAAVAVLCARLLIRSRSGPVVYWLGGWYPRDGVALGISLTVDPLGAGLALVSAILVLAALVFASRYFDDLHAHFHVLVLAFLAALCGFGLTGDLFNLFVWFELMSAAAFALCGYKSEEPASLQGALHFAVLNTVGAFLVLFGIALLYGRTGALNLSQIGRALAGRADGLVLVSFALLSCGFLVKGALVPFHFWLADAHAVAPTPVCILFSGIMVEAGLFAVARVYGTVFAPSLASFEPHLRAIVLGFGALTAVAGALLCFAQRHLKRLLAFSTVSHMGILVCAFGLLSAEGISGAALYAVGHGFVKGALFVCAGSLLHRYRSVDELKLHGRARQERLLFALFAASALFLCGLAPTALFAGESAIDSAAQAHGIHWLPPLVLFAGALTAAAVLRACGRIFLGLGPREEDAPAVGGETDEEPETAPSGRLPATMWGTAAALLALSIAAGIAPGAREVAHRSASWLLDPAGTAARVLDGTVLPVPPPAPESEIGREIAKSLRGPLLAIAIAAAALGRKRMPMALRSAVAAIWNPLLRGLRLLHSGRIGDSLAWLAFGTAAFGGLCAALLR
ncbi:MAG: complex I subunit 5 family protein [Myxococcales bacterium]